MSRKPISIILAVLAIMTSLGAAIGMAQEQPIWYGPPPWDWNEGIAEAGRLL